ncbi:perlucin-like protein [Mytilus trossulus]|uniref:perlucin-like protein n=1 Tax=Mytilus trossulus TaxID=6551 RepID=UPI003007E31C
MNAKMMKIDNSRENKWMISVIKALGPPYGHRLGMQKDLNGKWRWLYDNSTLGFTNWNPGEPSAQGKCVVLFNYDSRTWNDGGCTQQKPYICEKEKEKCSLKFDT